jgi:hypothetical protein
VITFLREKNCFYGFNFFLKTIKFTLTDNKFKF